MSPIVALVPLAAPALLVAAALLAYASPGPRPRRALAAAQGAALAALALAVAAAVGLLLAGPATSALIGAGGIGLSVRLDALSATLFALVGFLGAIVVAYSRRYLDGEARQGAFTGHLCLTLAAVLLLVLSGNLVQLVAAWIATSAALHRLLLFYGERPKAALAARKKFLTARLADATLIVAAVVIGVQFGTTDIATILERAAAADGAPAGVGLAAVLVAVAALVKSAQFPAHGWLPEVMETPTPVSALLHAGIINAGGFLVIRFADVMVLSAASLHILALVGGFTALFGAAVMLTQTSVKVSLAWSTVSQMGFMLLQCGLGLFALALLHIVAHSLYKAHAFLSSGSVVEIARASFVPDRTPPGLGATLASLALAVALYAGVGWTFGLSPAAAPQALALGAILVMALTLLLSQAAAGASSGPVIGRTAAAAGAVSVAYFALHAGAGALYAGVVPPPPAADALGYAIMALAVVSFAAVTVLQIVEPSRATAPFWRAARIHLANGLYVNAAFDRLIGALDRPAASPK
ncbi:NADH-quinone oxidoreductase subunit L [Aquibium sp. A9E412]|uniref:NADH-quinone oxidoreductase subunit L n=1 Tax=Aquibium sp. A9E412 TaxID=2976767 RepID=UPI0025AF845F|nr:NADH-quinone oxidoreductase subunit L [Aquibium sp. A9E412]MDN2565545.1 NADH-quinone oxidoreductase subunit L [Aquibium sp. A9E412]